MNYRDLLHNTGQFEEITDFNIGAIWIDEQGELNIRSEYDLYNMNNLKAFEQRVLIAIEAIDTELGSIATYSKKNDVVINGMVACIVSRIIDTKLTFGFRFCKVDAYLGDVEKSSCGDFNEFIVWKANELSTGHEIYKGYIIDSSVTTLIRRLNGKYLNRTTDVGSAKYMIDNDCV